MEEKMNKFINDNLGKINQHDQTVINVVCQNNIATLPPKYGIWSFEGKKYALQFNERQRPWLKYDEEEFIKAYNHPAILHYVYPKPFWRINRPIFNKEWWEYARISGFYYYVYNKSPKFKSFKRKKSKNLFKRILQGIDFLYFAFVTIFGFLFLFKIYKKEIFQKIQNWLMMLLLIIRLLFYRF